MTGNSATSRRTPVKGSWGAEIIPELPPAPGDYRVEKTRYSAFAHTNLDDILKQEQVEEVHVVGVMTSICVMETVKELFDRDLPAWCTARGWRTRTPTPTPSP